MQGLLFGFLFGYFQNGYFYFQKRDTVNFQPLSAFYFLLLIYCMFDWQPYRDSANSTNYDFAVNAYHYYMFSFIEGVATDKPRNEFSFIALLFTLCAISFKLSGIFCSCSFSTTYSYHGEQSSGFLPLLLEFLSSYAGTIKELHHHRLSIVPFAIKHKSLLIGSCQNTTGQRDSTDISFCLNRF